MTLSDVSKVSDYKFILGQIGPRRGVSELSSSGVGERWEQFVPGQNQTPMNATYSCGGDVVIHGTSPDGQQLVFLGSRPTAAPKRLLIDVMSPVAAAVVGAIMTVAPWRRRGSESWADWSCSSSYEWVARFDRRLSVTEARRRARQIQVNADRRRLEFFARDAEREFALAKMYDL